MLGSSRSDVSLRGFGCGTSVICHSERSPGISHFTWNLELDGLKPSSSGRPISLCYYAMA